MHNANIDVGTRLIKEQYVLNSIYNKMRCFSVPKPIGIIWKDGRLFSFTSFIRGFPFQFKTVNNPHQKPWETVARIAVEVHGIPVQNLPEVLKQYRNIKDQVLGEIKDFRRLDVPE